MATKADFTADEWQLLLGSPTLAGMAVTLGDPNGLWGLMKEGIASGRAMLEARNAPGANGLISELVAEMETSQGRAVAREGMKDELSGKSPAEMKAQILATLGEVGALLDAKAPQDAPAFKAWLEHIARQVAEAAKEGGVLGFGGVQVSPSEQAVLADIGKALNLA